MKHICRYLVATDSPDLFNCTCPVQPAEHCHPFVKLELPVVYCPECPCRSPAKQKSRGLGDTVAKITKAVGIKTCGGCEKRREKLNRLVPYKQSED